MDPVSAAASLAALFQISNAILTSCYRYIGKVKSAEVEITRVISEVGSLTAILADLKELVDEHGSELAYLSSLGVQNGPIDICFRALEQLNSKLAPAANQSGVRRRLLWPFESKKVQEILEIIEKQKTTFQLALTEYSTRVAVESGAGISQIQESVQSIDDRMKRERIFKWYKSSDPEQNHLASREKHEPETSKWVFDTSAFQRWKSTPGQTMWLHGIPGAGKTILCSSIIEYMKEVCQQTPTSEFAYFYFDFSDTRKQSISGFIRSIILQLSIQRSIVPEKVEALYDKCQNVQQEPMLDELREILFSLLDGSNQTFLIIDALDECDLEEREKFFRTFFDDKIPKNGNLNLLMTSRRETDIDSALKDVVEHNVSIQSAIIDADVRIHVRQVISKHRKLMKWQPAMRRDIEDSIVEGAHGMFRWATCQLEIIKKCLTPAMTRRELKRMPETLDGTYDRILMDMPEFYVNHVKTAMTWLAFSIRPVTLQELADAVVIDVESQSFDVNERLRDPTDVLDLCSSLVAVSTSGSSAEAWIRDKREIEGKHTLENHTLVTLAHYSVKEYIISERLHSSSLSHFYISERVAQRVIAESCLIYLIDFNGGERAIHLDFDTFPLLAYAGKYWYEHRQGIPTANDQTTIRVLIDRLFDLDDLSSFINWLNVYNPDFIASYDNYKYINKGKSAEAFPQPLYYAALLGDHELAESILAQGASTKINTRGGLQGTSLQAAASKGHESIVRLLLSHGADVNISGGSLGNALQAAAIGGSETAVKLILEAGAEVNAKGGEWGTALVAASSRENHGIMSLLLANGADIDMGTRTHGKALFAAASSGDISMVNILLAAGADINDDNDSEGTALYAASQRGSVPLVQLLLKRGSDVNKASGECMYPLQVAAGEGHVEIMKILLKSGANVNARGGKYHDALQASVESWNMDALNLLLDHGAEVNTQGGVYKSAFFAGVSTGNVLAASVLLEKGAPITDQIFLEAVCSDHRYLVKALLKAGANVDAHAGERGSALILAIERSSKEIAWAILARNPDVNAVGGEHRNALQAAVTKKMHDVAVELLGRGADIDATGGYYGTSLQSACAQGELNTVSMLIEKGAIVNSRGGWFGSPLIAACKNQHEPVIRFLLDHNADPNAAGRREGTALQALAGTANMVLISLLLSNGAQINGVPGEDGNTLEYAIQSGDEAVVRFFLDRGADVTGSLDNVDKPWQSPLCSAIHGGMLDLVPVLLEAGADMNGSGQNGTALQAALRSNADDVVALLLNRGVNVNKHGSYGSPLHDVISRKRPSELVKKILDAGADVDAAIAIYGTPLMAAAKKGDKALVSLLLDYGANINLTIEIFGGALQIAAQEGDIEMVQLLLDRGADVNATCEGGHTGHALMGSVRNHFETIMRLLLDHGADPNVRDGYILSQAAAQGENAVLQTLLDSGILEENRKRFLSQALQSAARWGKPETCQWLLDRGADINYEGWRFGSALQASVCEDYGPRHEGVLQIVRMLIEKGADVNLGCGDYGGALMAAICNANGEIVRTLVDAGADLNVRGGELDSVLQAIARHGSPVAVRFFVESGVDVHTVGGKYGTALQALCYKHDLESMKLLVEYGADVHLSAGKYGNCLQAAAHKKSNREDNENKSVAAMEFLLSKGVDVNAKGGKYFTALQCAARHGNLEGVRFLLANGADVRAEGGKLGTALLAAEDQKQFHVVTFLKRYIAKLDAAQEGGEGEITSVSLPENKTLKKVSETFKPTHNPRYQTKALMWGSSAIMVTNPVND